MAQHFCRIRGISCATLDR